MDWFVKRFLKASLAWLSLGVTLGLAMAVHPVWAIYKPAHLHMNVLGFVTMMIYGVAYHVIPRFTGHPLHSRRAAGAQWWLANAGLLLMVCGFVHRANGGVTLGAVLLGAGGTLAAAGAYTFAYVLWRTIDGPRAARAAATRTGENGRPRLPLAG